MNTRGRRSPHPQPSCKPAGGQRGGENSWQEEPGGDGGVQGLRSFLSKNTCIQCPVSCGLGTSWIVRKGRVFKSKLSDCWNLLSVLDTASYSKRSIRAFKTPLKEIHQTWLNWVIGWFSGDRMIYCTQPNCIFITLEQSKQYFWRSMLFSAIKCVCSNQVLIWPLILTMFFRFQL